MRGQLYVPAYDLRQSVPPRYVLQLSGVLSGALLTLLGQKWV